MGGMLIYILKQVKKLTIVYRWQWSWMLVVQSWRWRCSICFFIPVIRRRTVGLMILSRTIILCIWLGPLTRMISRWRIASSGCTALRSLVLGLFFRRRWKGSTIIWTSGESGWWWRMAASWFSVAMAMRATLLAATFAIAPTVMRRYWCWCWWWWWWTGFRTWLWAC